jgi:hypothetical protein
LTDVSGCSTADSFSTKEGHSLHVVGMSRVDRFFLVQHTKTGKNIPKLLQNIPNGSEIDRMAIPFTNIFHCKKLQNLPKFGFLV